MTRMLVAAALLAWLSCTAMAQTILFSRMSHNGWVLEYPLILPDRFDARTRYPVLPGLPPGDQFKQLVLAGPQL
jgi:hypothetical protein